MKIGRRGFLITALAAISAAATRKWPAIKWPERAKRVTTDLTAILNDDSDFLMETQLQMADALRREFEAELFATDSGRLIFVDEKNGKDHHDGMTPETAKRTKVAALAIAQAEPGDVIVRFPTSDQEFEMDYGFHEVAE